MRRLRYPVPTGPVGRMMQRPGGKHGTTIVVVVLLLTVAACSSSPAAPIDQASVASSAPIATQAPQDTSPAAAGPEVQSELESNGTSGEELSGALPYLGRWKVVELTGSVTTVQDGPAPPAGICSPFSDTYQPILDDTNTWVGLSDTPLDASGIEMLQLMLAMSGETDFDVSTFPSPSRLLPSAAGIAFEGEPDATFLFSFAFDNGYYSNETLDGLDTYYLEVEHLATVTTYGGGFIDLGDEQAVRGWSSSAISGTAQGQSFFFVTGTLVDANRMAGTWEFFESSRLADCELTGEGSGEWSAEAG